MLVADLRNQFPGLPARLELEDKPASSGGEGNVYFTRDGQWAVKVYHQISERKQRKIEFIHELFRDLSVSQEKFLVPPKALVAALGGKPAIGVVMKRVPNPPFRELVKFISDVGAAGQQLDAGKTWRDYLRMARAVAETLVVLHGKGCAHSDVHYRNFLADIDTCHVIMLETDGVVVEGFLDPDVKGLRGFIAPEVLIDSIPPNERTDRWSLAVLVLYTLLFRNVMNPRRQYHDDPQVNVVLAYGQYALFSEHPEDDTNRPPRLGAPLLEGGALSYKMLTPRLRRLTEEALIDGAFNPMIRPTSRQWMEALAMAIDELVDCRNCFQPFPYPHRDPLAAGGTYGDAAVGGENGRGVLGCPFCGTPLLQAVGGRSPVVLHLYDESTTAEYLPAGRVVVLTDGSPLYRDMIDLTLSVPPSERLPEDKVGRIVWDPTRHRYLLVNETEDEEWTAWTLAGGARRVARPGQALLVQSGLCIRFGAGTEKQRRDAAGNFHESRRLALVAETQKPGTAA